MMPLYSAGGQSIGAFTAEALDSPLKILLKILF
jgi:hypothetical protein